MRIEVVHALPDAQHMVALELDDGATVADAIVPGKLPAFGLRDHTVARNFHLAEVI